MSWIRIIRSSKIYILSHWNIIFRWLLVWENDIIWRMDGMGFRYKLISEFETRGKRMVTVMINGNAHVIELEEWRIIWGRNNIDKWLNPRKYKYRKRNKFSA